MASLNWKLCVSEITRNRVEAVGLDILADSEMPGRLNVRVVLLDRRGLLARCLVKADHIYDCRILRGTSSLSSWIMMHLKEVEVEFGSKSNRKRGQKQAGQVSLRHHVGFLQKMMGEFFLHSSDLGIYISSCELGIFLLLDHKFYICRRKIK
jgi:hypothetical protein